jgi:lipopolysaccharide/colanic/teichoic acid biosynthesis glycosyltransferase
MSTSLPLPSSSLQLDTIPREGRADPVPSPAARRGGAELAASAAARSFAKRAVDVAGAAAGLVLLAPLMLLLALLVRLSSPGPALFRQLRQGHNGRAFWFLKFRTMTADAEHRLCDLEALNEAAGGVLFKMRRDPRVTPLGRLLRRTSLDELPQLINVLRGEMSLVGPRPLQMRDSALLEQLEPEAHARRLSVLPGLTGAWQVGGRSETDSQGMLQLDLEYIEQWSLGRDLAILCKTAGAVIRGRGAY